MSPDVNESVVDAAGLEWFGGWVMPSGTGHISRLEGVNGKRKSSVRSKIRC